MDVIDIDLGLNEIIENVKEFSEKKVKVGIQSGETTETHRNQSYGTTYGGENLAYVASLHEFGSPGGMIPERSFIRAGLEEKQSHLEGEFADQAAKIFAAGASPTQVLNLLGLEATGIIQEKIVSGPFTPDAPETIKRKGSDKPLIDTGHLRQSIRHKLED